MNVGLPKLCEWFCRVQCISFSMGLGSAPIATKAEPAKQMMPWETKPAMAESQRPKFYPECVDLLDFEIDSVLTQVLQRLNQKLPSRVCPSKWIQEQQKAEALRKNLDNWRNPQPFLNFY